MTYADCKKFDEWLLENYGVLPEDLTDDEYDMAYAAYYAAIHDFNF